MKYSLVKDNNEIIIKITDLSENDFDWVVNYFTAILSMKLPLLLED
jgi:hypothetical protein